MGNTPQPRRALTASSRIVAVACGTLSWLAGDARAQDVARDPVQAEALFRAGVDLLQKDDFAAACPKFDESMRLDPSLGAQINIARCREHEGKLASAWAAFRAASDLNRRPDGTFRDDQAQAFVAERIAALEPRLPRLVIDVTPDVEGLTILRDGRPFARAGLADPQPVDAGEHVVEASAPGYVTKRASVVAEEGKRVAITITLERAVAAPEPPPTARPPVTPPAPKEEAPTGLGVRGFIGIGLASAGGAALIAAAITGGLAASKESELESFDASGDCRKDEIDGRTRRICRGAVAADARDITEAGQGLATASTVTLFLGAASATVGLLLILTDTGARDEGAVTFSIGPSHVALGGTF